MALATTRRETWQSLAPCTLLSLGHERQEQEEQITRLINRPTERGWRTLDRTQSMDRPHSEGVTARQEAAVGDGTGAGRKGGAI